MKNKIVILISLSFFFGCITSKEVKNLQKDKRILYPIGEDNKWGFANSDGETIIEPVYESVDFFTQGLALVKSNGKYGFIKKDGSWHIKAKYDSCTSFILDCASASIGNNSFLINKQGRKIKTKDCYSFDGGGCLIELPANPNEYFKIVDGKYELEYKYYLKLDTSNYVVVRDTSNWEIDEIIPFGRSHILLRKNDKYGLFDIWSHTGITIDKAVHSNHKKEAHSQLSNMIEFKYDDVEFERFRDNEVSYAKVKIKDRYGVIDSRGNLVLDAEFDSLKIKSPGRMALVEFEPNKFGYKNFNGKEYFQRKPPQ